MKTIIDSNTGKVIYTTSIETELQENEIEEKEGMHVYISDLVVRKKYRNQGIGHNLMKYAEKFAKENSIKEIHLTVLTSNTSALNLYLKKGYKTKMISLIKKLK